MTSNWFTVRVDYHSCAIFKTLVLTHVTFLHLNKIEMMYERLIVNIEVHRGSPLTFTHDLPYIASILFTHVKKIMQRWKSTFRTNLLHEYLQE